MEKRLHLPDFQAMDRISRINFFNSLSGVKSASLIGTLSHRGIANVAIFNSVVHLGANPPYLGFILRPLTVPRHTYHNIKAQGCFTINLVPYELITAAHQTSADYPENVSEFDACGLTPLYSELHRAPYVAECPLRIGLRLVEEHPIKANGTILVVGEIIEVQVPEEIIDPSGHINIEKCNIVSVGGLDTYYRPEFLTRLSYARVHTPVHNKAE